MQTSPSRIALVTGANKGIGLEIAGTLARKGMRVLLGARNPELGGAAAAQLREQGLDVQFLELDLSRPDTLHDAAAWIEKHGEKLDVLVNNAGLERITPMATDGDEVERSFARVVEINIIGTYYVTREAVRSMTAGSSIIITASIWSKSAAAEFSAYVISKHGNLGFMRVLAKELGPRGIRVNAVCPGWVKTRAALNSLAAMSGRQGVSQDEMLDEIIRAQALPGLMEPADVTSLYLFLASDLARNITGQAVNVDRGEVMA